MELIEGIGFALTIVALGFLFCKQIYQELYRKHKPEKAAALEKAQQQKRRLLNSPNHDAKEKDVAAHNRPRVVPPHRSEERHSALTDISTKPHTALKQRRLGDESHLLRELHHKNAYAIKEGRKPSRAATITFALSSPQKMILFQELMGKPLAMRTDLNDSWNHFS